MQSVKHPHIVNAYALHEDSVTVWICMELCDGGSLEHRVRRDGPCADSARLTRELLDAISYLHSKRIVHRDVKPDNLLLDGRGQLRLADFNSAKRIGSTANGAMLTDRGTHDFAAPELRFGRCWTERVDEWAAGLSAWFMLKARLPFRVLDASVADSLLHGQLPEMDWSGLSESMRNFMEQILAVDPSDRTPALELLWHPALAEDLDAGSECNDFSPKTFQVLEVPGFQLGAEKEETNDVESLPPASPAPAKAEPGNLPSRRFRGRFRNADRYRTQGAEKQEERRQLPEAESLWQREPRSGPEALQILAKTKCARIHPSRPAREHFHTSFGASALVWESPMAP